MLPPQVTRTFAAGVAVAAAAVLPLLTSSAAGGAVVADYQDDFTVSGDPAARNGWSYLWNSGGPLDQLSSYTELTIDNGRYETVDDDGYPDAAPGTYLSAGRSDPATAQYPDDPDPNAPAVPTTFVRPGQGFEENVNERAIMLRYTFSEADIPGGADGTASITDFNFVVPTNATPDGLSARVLDRDFNVIQNFSSETFFPFGPGFRFDRRLDPRPIALGNYAAGDSVYFLIGSEEFGSLSDETTGLVTHLDEMRLDVTIDAVPEPASGLVLLGVATAGLLARRRRA